MLAGAFLVDAYVTEGRPFLALGYPHGATKAGHLIRGHQPSMIVPVPGEGRTMALDRIGYKALRGIVLDPMKCLQHRFNVLACKVSHQFVQRDIIMVL